MAADETASSPPIIRPATAADADGVAMLVGDLGYPVAPDQAHARLAAVLAAGDAVLLAFRPGDPAPIGLIALQRLAMLQVARPMLRITTLVVRADQRGGGLGAELLRRAEEEARRHGAGMLEVTTNKRRTRAQAFYQAHGFAPTSLRLHRILAEEGGGTEVR